MIAGTVLHGIAASSGIALGKAVVLRSASPQGQQPAMPESPQAAIARWLGARDAAKRSLDRLLERGTRDRSPEERALLEAQQMMVLDPDLEASVRTLVLAGRSPEDATRVAIDRFASAMAKITDEYLRQRADDVREMGQALLRVLAGGQAFPMADLESGSVLCAAELAAPSLLMVDRKALAGIALASGGPTSHVAIVARSWGVPAVVGIAALMDSVAQGDEVALDGSTGQMWLKPDSVEVSALRSRARQVAAANEDLAALAGKPAMTRDGVRIELMANIGGTDDVAAALAAGAEGVGLFRTEFLITGREALPSEEEQFRLYREVVESLHGRSVVLRTFDIGADKSVPALHLAPEPNPALGYRGIRIGLDRPRLLATQLRAVLRVSAYAPVAVMLPMVATIDEVRQAKLLLKQAADELKLGSGRPVPLGVMVETPAAALLSPRLAHEVDFFSLGTNDLIQYTMAADRTNDRVAALYQPYHPSVLQLIGTVAAAASAAGIRCAVCGEMASDPHAAPLLVGLGVRELSMSSSAIGRVKHQILRFGQAEARELASAAVGKATAGEVHDLVEDFVKRLN